MYKHLKNMLLPIYIYGTSVLREKAQPVDLETEEGKEERLKGIKELLNDMYQTMKHADGVGIAAPQVGKSLRMLIVDGTGLAEDMPELKDFKRYMINPVVTMESAETAEYSEGCLSVPDIHADVTRPKTIEVEYFNEKFEKIKETFTGFACRMVEHEMDHLNGHMFIDRVSPIRRKLMAAKLAKLQGGKVRTSYKTVTASRSK